MGESGAGELSVERGVRGRECGVRGVRERERGVRVRGVRGVCGCQPRMDSVLDPSESGPGLE